MNTTPWLIFLVLTTLTATACAKAPRERPLDTKPTETGANTTTAVRKSLEGEWILVSLEVAAEDGRHVSVPAEGELSLDGFGNLRIVYRVPEAGLEALQTIGVRSPNPVISTTGAVQIDAQQRRIMYVAPDAGARAFDPDLAAKRANPFALERVRYYTLGADGVLTLTTRHDNGLDAATSQWKKRS